MGQLLGRGIGGTSGSLEEKRLKLNLHALEREEPSSHVRSQEEQRPVATPIGEWSWMFSRD